MKPEDIITDAEIERVHGHADFGEGTVKREVVNRALLKCACGYYDGHTARTIIADHGLIRDARARGSATALTARGRKYLWAVFGKSL